MSIQETRRANIPPQPIPSTRAVPSARKGKRQATERTKPIEKLPAASSSGPAGADEASQRSNPKMTTPRRQSKRAANASGSACGSPQPKELLPSPYILSDVETIGIARNDGAPGQGEPLNPLSPVIAEIVQLWRMRQRWHRAEKSLTLQGRALCRSWTSGDKDSANDLFDAAQAGDPVDPMLRMALMPFLSAIKNFEPERKLIEKRLRVLAKSLPVFPWVFTVTGFGELNFAALVGECGDIGSYRNPSCVWKRMGMAVIEGERQRKKTDPDEALLHGYNPSRRAVAYLIGECLIKAGDKCRYREVYTARRAHTAETHPDWTKGHSHNDAMRVMTKRVLRDLWIEWRRIDRCGSEAA